MEIAVQLNGVIEGQDVLVVEVREHALDASNTAEFEDAAQGLIGDRKKVVLDLSSVDVIDSSGIVALIRCLREVFRRHGELRLCALSQTVQALLEVMHMAPFFDIHASRSEAVAAFG